MGKVVKTVLKVAAGVAIAAFAPQLAGAMLKTIGVGGALASTVATAAVGAGLGQVSGLGWQTGALLGGLAGAGKSGLFGGTSQTATAAGGAGAPAAGVAPATATTTAPVGGVAGTAADAASRVADAARAAGTAAAPQTLGSTLSGAASKVGNVLQQGVSNVRAGVGGALGAVGLGGLATSGTLGAVAPALIGGALAGAPMAEMAKAQEAELKRAQQVNAALTQQRLDQANQLIGEAAYYDPEYMARQAAEAAMIRGGIQATEGTRGLTGERLAAERRRYRLGTARTAGSAYQQGYGTGVGARLQTRQAGISAIPTEYQLTNPMGALAVSDAARRAKAEEEAGLGALFGQILGQGKTTSRGA